MMDIKQARDTAIADTMTSIRAIEQDGPINYDTLKAIRAELITLADDKSLFPRDQFPLTETGESAIYRLSEDVDHRFALYGSTGRLVNQSLRIITLPGPSSLVCTVMN